MAVAVVVALRAVLPFALARAGAWAGTRALGEPVTIEDVDLRLLSGGLVVKGLAAGPYLRFARAEANIAWRDLVRGRIRVEELSLAAPRLSLTREPDGRIEPLDRLGGSEEPAPEAEAGPSGPPPSFRVDRVSVSDAKLVLNDAGGATAPLEIGFAHLGVSDLTSDEGRIGLGEIALAQPVLRVRRDLAFGGGETAASAPKPAAAPPAPAAEPAASPATYRITHLEINDADLALVSAGEPLEARLSLDADELSLDRDAPFPLRLELALGGGTLELDGRAALNPLAFHGKVRWKDLPVPPITLAARPELGEWVHSCRASGDLEVEARLAKSAAGPPRVSAKGTLGVRDLDLSDPAGDVRLAWSSLELALDGLSLPLGADAATGPEIDLGRVALSQPRIRYTHPTDAFAALGGGGADGASADGAAEAAEPAPGPTLRIGQLEVHDGQLEVRDASVKPAFDGRIAGLQVAASDVRLPQGDARSLNITGRAPGGAPFELSGDVQQRAGTLRLVLDRLGLAQLTPYASAVGYRIQQGSASLDSQVALDAGKVDADNHLVLHNVALTGSGDGTLERYLGMPPRLALAVLRDERGRISVDIPVRTSESGSDVGLATVARDAVVQALRGALTSPLKVAGMVLPEGGGPLERKALEAVPGKAEFQRDPQEVLAPLQAMLRERPSLGVELIGQTSEADRAGLAEALLIERVRAGDGLPDVAAGDDAGWFARRRIVAALRERGEGKPAPLGPEDAAVLDRMLAETEVPQERFAELARQRAEAGRAVLLEHGDLDPQRVRIGSPRKGKPGIVADYFPWTPAAASEPEPPPT